MENKLKSFLNSKAYVRTTFALAILIVLSLTFLAGVQVGIRKAKYSFEWGANYERNFMGPRRGMMGPGGFGQKGPRGFFPDGPRDMRNAYGVGGEIISIAENLIVIKDPDNKENTVSVNEKTIIKAGREDIKISDLKTGDKIVVMGKPGDNGTVSAELIRDFK